MEATVSEIREMLRAADADEFAAIEHALAADGRKGVRSALDAARKRLDAEAAEARRLEGLHAFDAAALAEAGAAGGVLVGLDEVGRGAVAGPLAVGAVVFEGSPAIADLNDSKQLKPDVRERVARDIKQAAAAWAVVYVEPDVIDEQGMAASLRSAFSSAIAAVEASGVAVDVVLLDGNPLRVDPRERTVVKGDSKSAAIAAASVVAKVERDALMRGLDSTFPQYGFPDNKGYGSPDHIAAIRKFGLSPVHRASFCKSFMQESLF